MPTLYQIITIALASAFVIQFIGKAGLRDFIIERSCKFISKLFGCEFCLCFWTNLAICLLLIIITGNFALLVVPVLSTPLTRYIV